MFVDRAEEQSWAVGDVLSLLRAVQPEDEEAKGFLSHVVGRMDNLTVSCK